MEWNDYIKLNRRQRNSLFKKALSGNDKALKQYLGITRSIKKETNTRLRNLERGNLAYGSVYNNLVYYLNSELDSNRLKSVSALNYDLFDIHQQNEHALKFLKNKASNPKYAREAESYRIDRLQEMGALPENFSRRKSIDFLRFLGSEEVTATIDAYGVSESVVEMLYDAYENSNKSSDTLNILRGSLLEFLADEITFDKAMERVGIKVEDYHSGRPTS